MPSVPTELERWTRTKHPKEHQSGCNTEVTSLNTKLELANYPGRMEYEGWPHVWENHESLSSGNQITTRISDNSNLFPPSNGTSASSWMVVASSHQVMVTRYGQCPARIIKIVLTQLPQPSWRSIAWRETDRQGLSTSDVGSAGSQPISVAHQVT